MKYAAQHVGITVSAVWTKRIYELHIAYGVPSKRESPQEPDVIRKKY